MSRRIEWNSQHNSPDAQEDSFVNEYLTWSAKRKWQYLMKLAKQGLKKSNTTGKRRIVWK